MVPISSFTAPSRVKAADPVVTAKCVLDIRIGQDKQVPLRRLVIGLFGNEAPILTRTFAKACAGTYPGEAGLQARYGLSEVRSISKDRLVAWANFPGGNYLFRRTAPSKGGMAKEENIPLAGQDTKTDETNSLKHDVIGRVSMPKGGGTFNFVVSPVEKAPWLDRNNVVIGQVLEGLDVLKDINLVKVTKKGGILNAFDNLADDGGEKESAKDYLLLPLQKVKVFKSELVDL